MNRDCPFYHELILDAEWLDEGERAMLMQHLSQCPACREQFELVSQFEDLLNADAVARMPADLCERIVSAVAQDDVPVSAGVAGPVLGAVVLLLTAVLYGQRGLLEGLSERASGMLGWGSDLVSPIGVGLGAVFRGMLASAATSCFGVPQTVWWLVAAALTLTCLFSGGLFYSEEKQHV